MPDDSSDAAPRVDPDWPSNARVPLDVSAYQARFAQDYERLRGHGGEFWKLERRQHFQEPDMPSWLAYRRGDWQESVRLAEELRPGLEREYQDDAAHGIRTRWVKVVERPITPYVQWAFAPLRVRAQSGEHMRVVTAEQARRFEATSLLPEMITLDNEVLYEIEYDEAGAHTGAVRIDDPEVVTGCQRVIADLYEIGEDVESFYRREVAHLEPPVG